MQEREAAARRRQRELRLKVDKAAADLRRAEATRAVRDRALAETLEQRESVRADRRKQAERATTLERQLSELRSSRVYRFVRLTWRVRAALMRPLRGRRGSGAH